MKTKEPQERFNTHCLTSFDVHNQFCLPKIGIVFLPFYQSLRDFRWMVTFQKWVKCFWKIGFLIFATSHR